MQTLETTKESSVVPNDFSLYVGKPLTDADEVLKNCHKNQSQSIQFSKFFWGGMPQTPLAIACFACWLCFAQHGSQAIF